MNTNPPPKNGRGQCCGRQVSELKPFGEERHPLFGDLDGALLVKRWRPLLPDDPRPKSIHGEMIVLVPTGAGSMEPKRFLVERFGDEKAVEIRLITR
jgi:hypothetical protein